MVMQVELAVGRDTIGGGGGGGGSIRTGRMRNLTY